MLKGAGIFDEGIGEVRGEEFGVDECCGEQGFICAGLGDGKCCVYSVVGEGGRTNAWRRVLRKDVSP